MRTVPSIVLVMLMVALPGCSGRDDASDAGPLAGHEAGERVAVRRGPEAAIPDDGSQRASATSAGQHGGTSPEQRHRRGDPDCARIETRTRSVASVSGGPMQMIMVTECVPARR